MKTDAKPDRHDDGGREPLRAVLQGWSVPEVPGEIEDALRQQFRRRRPRRSLAVWLSLAAGFGLLAAWPLVSPRLEERPPAPVPSSGAATGLLSPPPLASSELAPAAATPMPATARSARVGRRAARLKAAAPAVVVEPAQAELLAEFGRRAWEKTEAAPGTSLPRMPAGEAPAYRVEWKEVAGEWPAVQVVVPTSGR